MKVLVYGNGARENAIAWKISQSNLLSKLYLAECNDGFKHLGEIIEYLDFQDLAAKSRELGINLLVVGPELPLSQGIVDVFKCHGIPSVGVTKDWARLESSKSFAKDFMNRNSISTASYTIIEDVSQIGEVLDAANYPVVLKADGLAAGKGVSIVNTRSEAQDLLEDFLNGKYSEASKKVVVEEFIKGEELSLISLWDGKTIVPLVCARDYKRLLEKNEGPNTGGMGSYCPVELTNVQKRWVDEYLKNLQSALIKENADFTGVIYSGLMMNDSGLYVLEYNMRFGDPETQALMMHLDSDLLEIFYLLVSKRLSEVVLDWKNGISACLVIASEGYPESPKKGSEIKNVDFIKSELDVDIFYAGVKNSKNCLVSNGGRVLSICKNADNPYPFLYAAANRLEFKDKIYRGDIGGYNAGSCYSSGFSK